MGEQLLKKVKYCILIVVLGVSMAAQAEVTPVAHYNLGVQGGIRDTAAPTVWESLVPGGPELTRQGSPRIMSDGPASRRLIYDSSIKFEADDQCYQAPKHLAVGNHWVLETWAYALNANDPGYHAVVANGHGGKGFLLCQKDDQWAVLVGGVGVFTIAPVKAEIWTHLALVRQGGKTDAYINGKRQPSSLPAMGGGVHNFGIGATSPGKEPFRGWIAEVRVANYEPGKFDPVSDFLMDTAVLKKIQVEELSRQKRMLDTLLTADGVKAVDQFNEDATEQDWLITPPDTPATIQVRLTHNGQSAQIMLTNGLISRTFLVTGGNLGCISLRRSDKDIEFIRAVKPEVRIRINGAGWTEIGGLTGEPDRAFLTPSWLKNLTSKPGAFEFTGMKIGPTVAPYPWQPKCNAPVTPWPAAGRRVTFSFAPPASAPDHLKDLSIDVHYEIYQGLPVIMKTFRVSNGSTKDIEVTQFEGEHLAVQPTVSRMLHVESDYSFGTANFVKEGSALGIHIRGGDAFTPYVFGEGTTRFIRDPEWGSMATLNPAEDLFLDNPENALLLSRPTVGPNWTVEPGENFNAFRTFEILNDTTERERYHLAQRRFYKKLAPQSMEHQLEVHAPRTRDMRILAPLIDQMAELGFETLQSPEHPGGIDYADISEENINSMKAICDYAKPHGIRVGAYQLMMASRGRETEFNCINPATGKPGSVFGQSTCGASAWADMYYENMWKLIEQSGMGCFKPDGPYHGDPCASTEHANHKGLKDSQWAQWSWMCKVLKEGQRRNLYLTIPDYYVLNGQACTGMGYREATDNIDIVLQTVIYRQYIFDATFHKTAAMGWVNLNTEVLRGGMEENLDKYERSFFTLLCSGANVWVRGHRLYDGPKSKAMLKKWTDWNTRYRQIIQGDIIHLRRPDGRDLDYYLHVNPAGKEKGMLLVFNPLDKPVKKTINVPLYYTGLSKTASVCVEKGNSKRYTLGRDYSIQLPVDLEANGYTWIVIE